MANKQDNKSNHNPTNITGSVRPKSRHDSTSGLPVLFKGDKMNIIVAHESWHCADGSHNSGSDIFFSSTRAAHEYYQDGGFRLIRNPSFTIATKMFNPKIDVLTGEIVIMGGRCDVHFRQETVKQSA